MLKILVSRLRLKILAALLLAERGKKGSREKFDAALAKVADIEPEEHDKL